MEGPAGDGKQSKSNLPAPGWYADPSGDGGVRWWTGSEWAQRVASGRIDEAKQSTGGRQLRPASVWLAESINVCTRVSSDIFALISILVIPAFLALAGAVWYALREAAVVVSISSATGQPMIEEIRGGAEAAQGAVLVVSALALVWIGGFLLAMASSIQALQSNADRPATWLQSLAPLTHRPKSITVSLATFMTFSVFMAYVWFSGQTVALLLMIPSLFVALVVWTKYSFVPVVSVAGPKRPSVFRQSSSAVSGHFLAVLRRYLSLGMWTVLSSVSFLFLTRLITSGAAEDPSLPGTRDKFVFSFTGSFGNNIYLWFLLAVFASIFWGAIVSVWSGATALLYIELEGDVELADHPIRSDESE